ncbi:hypothetical protein COL922a_014887, partial [Colletotrichum nupharicola]
RGVTGYACLWLQHLVDNEDTPIDIPIWYTKNGKRLTQNYITENNVEEKRSPGLEDLREIGRLHFNCTFTPGIDESHERFVVDNNSRETFETWEACIAEGFLRRLSKSTRNRSYRAAISTRPQIPRNAAAGSIKRAMTGAAPSAKTPSLRFRII